MRLLCGTAIIGFLASVAAQPIAQASFIMESYNYIDGKTYISTIKDEDIAPTPAWEIEDGNPPLAVGQAVAAAKACLHTLDLGDHHWTIGSVSLKPSGLEGHWFYEIMFSCLGDDRAPMTFRVQVLMNGVAVVPRLEEKPTRTTGAPPN